LVAVAGSKSDADWLQAALSRIDRFLLKPLDLAQLDELLAGARR
jgi:hypothetical protein